MHRFYVPTLARGLVAFSQAQAHQIARVLRLSVGEQVEAFDGTGCVANVTLDGVSPQAVLGHVGELCVVPWPGAWHPVLHLTLIRPQRFEWAVEKATELGVWRIVPLVTARMVHGGQEIGAARLLRWQQIAVEAAEQCGSAFVPAVVPPCPLTTALARPAFCRLLAWEATGDTRRVTIAAALADAQPPPGAEIGLFIGPEGGFEPAEVAVAEAADCRLVSLGPRTLRAETAALTALAVLTAS